MKRSELVEILNAMPDVEVYIPEEYCDGWVKVTYANVSPSNDNMLCLMNNEQAATVVLDL